MKMIAVVALALVAAVTAAPAANQPEVHIVRSENVANPDGSYNVGFELDDGTSVNSQGQLKTVTNEENKQVDVLVQRGSYTAPNADGKFDIVEWSADESGFHASGPGIPQ